MSVDFSALAGTVTKDLETIGEDLHSSLSADVDQLRQALPGITAQAHQHVDSIASTVIGMLEAHLSKIEAVFGLHGVTATPVTPSAVPAPDPTVAPSTTPEASSAPSSSASTTGTTPAETAQA